MRYPRTPSFDEADVSDKYGLSGVRGRLPPRRSPTSTRRSGSGSASVQVLDANVGALVRRLEAQGTLDDTYVVFTSRQRLQHGRAPARHRQVQPVRGDRQRAAAGPRARASSPAPTIAELAGNIDLAPTIADMTDTPAPDRVDGLSLLPLLDGGGTTLPREHLLLSRGLIPLEKEALSAIEEFPETVVESPRHARLSDFNAVRDRAVEAGRLHQQRPRGALRPPQRPLRAHQPHGRGLAVAEADASRGSATWSATCAGPSSSCSSAKRPAAACDTAAA